MLTASDFFEDLKMVSWLRTGRAGLWLVGLCAGGAAWAQVPPSGAPAPEGASALVNTTASVSVFESYRTYDEPKAIPWREANDEVGRIGGWRAYAKEAQGGAAMVGAPEATPTDHEQHHSNGGRP